MGPSQAKPALLLYEVPLAYGEANQGRERADWKRVLDLSWGTTCPGASSGSTLDVLHCSAGVLRP